MRPLLPLLLLPALLSAAATDPTPAQLKLWDAQEKVFEAHRHGQLLNQVEQQALLIWRRHHRRTGPFPLWAIDRKGIL
jgi:hypothetical protein